MNNNQIENICIAVMVCCLIVCASLESIFGKKNK